MTMLPVITGLAAKCNEEMTGVTADAGLEALLAQGVAEWE